MILFIHLETLLLLELLLNLLLIQCLNLNLLVCIIINFEVVIFLEDLHLIINVKRKRTKIKYSEKKIVYYEKFLFKTVTRIEIH